MNKVLEQYLDLFGSSLVILRCVFPLSPRHHPASLRPLSGAHYRRPVPGPVGPDARPLDLAQLGPRGPLYQNSRRYHHDGPRLAHQTHHRGALPERLSGDVLEDVTAGFGHPGDSQSESDPVRAVYNSLLDR